MRMIDRERKQEEDTHTHTHTHAHTHVDILGEIIIVNIIERVSNN